MQEVFIALDFKDAETAWAFLEKFPATVRPAVKVGMELFYKEGPDMIRDLKAAGFKVFLDLKMYDIPHTVEKAATSVGQLDIDYLTIHAAGGIEMMQAAKRGVAAGAALVQATPPKLLAITQLTSFSEVAVQATQLLQVSLHESVVHLAQLAAKAGIDGTISSAYESEAIHAATSAGFLSVTPGIRLAGDAVDDQSRVVTPEKAALLGANGIVVGRSITQAADPVQAYETVVAAFATPVR